MFVEGKTTILNAMFRDKFSEVSMRRTTAGIDFFRIVAKDDQSSDKSDGPKDQEKGTVLATGGSSEKWSVISDEETQKAENILKEIETSNKELRQANKIEEKRFNIELDENLCKMRKDTSLVIVDIPGVNEADTDSIYMKYTNDNWDTFDCVVLVMDARQGVSTEEQVSLLKLVKKNLNEKKDLPVIILCNKVDDPDDTEQAMVVAEVRQKVSEIFCVGCREEALQKALNAATINPLQYPAGMFPVVIATSAVHAFFYRTASLLSFEEFEKKFDQDLIDKIGREEVGKFAWRKLSKTEKYQAVYKAVQGDSEYDERLEATAFDKFLKMLSLSLGGAEMQLQLLKKQVDVELKSLNRENCTLDRLRSMHDKCVLLGKDMTEFTRTFWVLYRACKDDVLAAFKEDMEVQNLTKPMKLLETYCSFIVLFGWKDEGQHLKDAAKEFICAQLGAIVNNIDLTKFAKSEHSQRCNKCRAKVQDSRPNNWRGFSLYDWTAIIESIKLLTFDKTFCESFGPELIMLTQIANKCTSLLGADEYCGCYHCAGMSNCKYYQCECDMCGRRLQEQDCFKNKEKWSVKFAAGKVYCQR